MYVMYCQLCSMAVLRCGLRAKTPPNCWPEHPNFFGIWFPGFKNTNDGHREIFYLEPPYRTTIFSWLIWFYGQIDNHIMWLNNTDINYTLGTALITVTNPIKQISSRLPGHILTKFQYFLHGDSPMNMLIVFAQVALLKVFLIMRQGR